jgi:hypothetical protein
MIGVVVGAVVVGTRDVVIGRVEMVGGVVVVRGEVSTGVVVEVVGGCIVVDAAVVVVVVPGKTAVVTCDVVTGATEVVGVN